MKIILNILLIFALPITLIANEENSRLLELLDKELSKSEINTANKKNKIQSLKLKINNLTSLEEEYHINMEIANEYQSYTCDSAVKYINMNIDIAKKMTNDYYLDESKIKLSFVYSLSGLFFQAAEMLSSIQYNKLPFELKKEYCWSYLRYYENLIKYTDDTKYSQDFVSQYNHYRTILLSILPKDSHEYLKENAFKLVSEGNYMAAFEILSDNYSKQESCTHEFAMAAMSMAEIYKSMGNKDLEEKYLILAATADIQLAVKEHQALLALAIHISEKNDASKENIKRAYSYIKIALDDANFYNSRFKNTVITRVQPIIEENYLMKIEQQSKNLRLYAILTSLLLLVLAIVMYCVYRQFKTIQQAQRKLQIMNDEQKILNNKLNESNIIKEEYIGFFMNQCAIYINKLEEVRKIINKRIKPGQIEGLNYMLFSTRSMQNDIAEFYNTFDEVFLDLFPSFVADLNALLKEESRFKLKPGQLNTELRIFALIRLGITDANQISVFLRYSLQTIYNYRSKIKGKAIAESDFFEEKVKKIGSFN